MHPILEILNLLHHHPPHSQIEAITDLSVVKWSIVTQRIAVEEAFTCPDVDSNKNTLQKQSGQDW